MLPNTLGVSVGGFFTFDLFDLLILILGVHCYIVLVLDECGHECPGMPKEAFETYISQKLLKFHS